MNHTCRIDSVKLFFIPVKTRVPLKFGAETLESAVVARTQIHLRDENGRAAAGWGETPLSAPWAWPSTSSVADRTETMQMLCRRIAGALSGAELGGHPFEIGRALLDRIVPEILSDLNQGRDEAIPHLAGLICTSLFDIAIHDAFGILNGIDTYDTYSSEYLANDLSEYLEPLPGSGVDFSGRYPTDFLERPGEQQLVAWHLVGGKDPVTPEELTGNEPSDGYPVLLDEWIERDQLACLKVKLRGNDEVWDFDRLVAVGDTGLRTSVDWLSADFNCTVTEPSYVNEILDRLRDRHPRIYGAILYVEQPFPYDLERHQIDVHSVSARKPLFMDESAHDWKLIRLGRELGWTGVALKTCKTQTGAILSLCWAKAHGMQLMVQDLTNPMIAQIPHLRLASHAGTIMGVETNSMQFYPAASEPEEAVHPGMYRRHGGTVNLDSLKGPGFGYRIDEIERALPPPEVL